MIGSNVPDDLDDRIERFLVALPEILHGHAGRVPRARAYRAALYDAGLAGLDVPAEYGGAGLGPAARIRFDQLAKGAVPSEDDVFTIGTGMAIPTILSHGSEQLRQRYVRPGLRGDEIWCQLYSEPGAGSDLAGLQTRATRTDRGWKLNGQKVWTSGAEVADLGICLARTNLDVPKHKGITMFVVPMRQPGVTVRPIEQITGASEFNEVFFDDVDIPEQNVVGECDRGWAVAVSLLRSERSTIGGGGGRQPVPFDRLRDLVAQRAELASSDTVRAALVDCLIGQRLAGLVDEYQAQSVAAGGRLGPETSVGKLWRSDNGRLASRLVADVAFTDGTSWEQDDDRDSWTFALLDACALSLGGGTDDVQRNTIAEQVLGLPRDPYRNDDVPFRDLRVGTQTS